MIFAIIYIGFMMWFPEKHSRVSRYKTFVVVTDSMAPKIEPMSLIIVDKTPETKYKVNDIITFKHDINGDGQLNVVTHRIGKIEGGENLTYRTKAENQKFDSWLIPEYNVVGKVYKIIPKIGLLVLGLQKIALPLLITYDLIILLLLAQTFLRWEQLDYNY